MINRRQLIKAGAGAYASTLINTAHAQEAAKPKRAVFIFIPLGSLAGGWRPMPCGDMTNSGQLLAPFASVANRCLVPCGVHLQRGGFGLPNFLLAQNAFHETTNSLDTILSQYLSTQKPTEGGHLRLCAKEPSSMIQPTVSVGNGKSLPFEDNPDQLADRLQAYGIPERSTTEMASPFDASIDSISTWNIKRYFGLTKLALQTGYSDVTTLMIGNDIGEIMAPPSLNLRLQEMLRIYAPSGLTAEYLLFKAYLHQLVAQFIQDLSTTLDMDGQPLLNSTMVYLFSNMADASSHVLHEAPALIAGADSAFRTGEMIEHNSSSYSLLNAIGYAFMGKDGLTFGEDIALNLLRY